MAHRILHLCTPLAILALGSCSYVYDLKAVMIDGRVAFVVAPGSDRQPDCIRSIQVRADDGEPNAKPAEGDDAALVVNGGVYLSDSRDVGSCDNPFPIFYGVELKGKRFEGVGYVAPKPLLIDAVYEVDAQGRGSGYGTSWFKIRADGQIENYSSDPTTPSRDSAGYVINEDKAD